MMRLWAFFGIPWWRGFQVSCSLSNCSQLMLTATFKGDRTKAMTETSVFGGSVRRAKLGRKKRDDEDDEDDEDMA